MGIAGLTRRLEHHATRYTPKDLHAYQAIVDGPSLAYHAHKLALLHMGDEPRIPSYADINRLAFRWLEALEALNIKVLAILFDGALPSSKTEERISRLTKSNQRVKLLRSYYAASACPIPITLGSVSYSFLAPALREFLGNSRFAHVTWDVPGEADEWCAAFAYAAPRSIIISSDSDMLLYEYHAETLIMFFGDIELMTEPEFRGYSPAHMTHALGMTSLVPFAYCLMLDKHRMFNALVERAKDVNMASKDYMDFSRRYQGPSITETGSILHPIPAIIDRLFTIPQHVDARVSELFHQMQSNIPSPAVYLPLLVEDPNVASAWNLGQDIRVLAYSLLAHSIVASHVPAIELTCNSQVLKEYRRKAQAISIQQLTLANRGDTVASAVLLDTIITASLERSQANQIPPELTWQLIATDLLLSNIPTPPKVSLLIRVLHCDFDKTWDFIHLTARYHAVLYSLRILKQCISVALTLSPPTPTEICQHMENIGRKFADMPSIVDLFLIPGQARLVSGHEERLRRYLPEVYQMHGLEVPSEKMSSKKARKKQREGERKARRKKEGEGKEAFNVFDVLNP